MTKIASAFLLRGDDPTLLGNALRALTDQLLEDEDRSIALEEVTDDGHRNEEGEYSLDTLLASAQTVPFLSDKRVVVGRDLGRFSKKDTIEPLLTYLENPLSTTRLVLVWEKGPTLQRLGQIPKVLIEAVEKSGEIIDTRVKGKSWEWIREQVDLSGVQLDRGALQALKENIGDDLASLSSILETLTSVYGVSTALGCEEIEPYLGASGDIPPWELSDAIASGNATLAIEKLQRLQKAGGRHEIQILAILHGHFSRILRLAGLNLSSDKEAAILLGDKGSTFRARKSQQEAQRLGNLRSREAITLLSEADLAIRGHSALAGGTILEVLVARLAYLYRG
jgi:DNA polymerase III subunit delta